MTDSVSAPRIPYGAWPSPITAADVARGQVLISYPMVTGTDVWWQEGRPDEGGRVTVVRCDADGQQRAMLPAPWNARSRVHEYGGRAYLPVPGRPGGGQGGPAGPAVVFANYEDQRLYLVSGPAGDAGPRAADGGRAAGGGADAGGADAGVPVPLTPATADDAPAALRFADFILSADGREVWCVRERHEAGKTTRSLVAVPLDGSAAGGARGDPRTRQRA